MYRFILVISIVLIYSKAFTQGNSKLLDSIIKSHPALFKIIQSKGKYRPQIIYTQINRNDANVPTFKNHTYLLDSNNYFYCASLVKLPCSVFALEKIRELNVKDLNSATAMLTDSAFICQKRCWSDTTARNGYPSIEHHIKKMLLVSDNNSYSRVFEFLTPTYIQSRLTKIGHPTARIVHRFDVPCIGRGNNYFNPIRFVDEKGSVVYYQPADSLTRDFKPVFENLVIGKNVYNRKKRLVSSAKDFSKSNYLSLEMVHNFLRNLIFNDYMPEKKKFNIDQNDWGFLMKHLAMYPRESEWPRYNQKEYYDSFKKYFIYGSATPLIESDTLRIFNIVGRAYGFVVDCAYIVDFRNGTEFMLSSAIYTNRRNSFGTGNYEYDTVGLPFLRELSLALYGFESGRKKEHLPQLGNLQFFKKTK